MARGNVDVKKIGRRHHCGENGNLRASISGMSSTSRLGYSGGGDIGEGIGRVKNIQGILGGGKMRGLRGKNR